MKQSNIIDYAKRIKNISYSNFWNKGENHELSIVMSSTL